jgi:polar amino acid transport system permease protein
LLGKGGILALGLNAGAFMSEIIRAGIESVETSQVEGAKSVGMSKIQNLLHIVLPQAVKMMLPPMGGIYVIIIKGTSIVSVIGISELVRAGEHATQRHPSQLMLIFGMVALMYFIYCYPVLRLAKWAEDKMRRVEIEH